MATTALMSGAQFDALPFEEGRRWELLSGDLVPVSSATPQHQEIVLTLAASLRAHLRRHRIGSVPPDVEFALTEQDRLLPDVAIILHDRWRNLESGKVPVAGSPHIAVEIISPSERSSDSAHKVWTYLRNGVEEVWQVLPESRSVLIYQAQAGTVILAGESLLRTSLLPGWEISLSEIFELSI